MERERFLCAISTAALHHNKICNAIIFSKQNNCNVIETSRHYNRVQNSTEKINNLTLGENYKIKSEESASTRSIKIIGPGAMDDYARLKRANDARWTNRARRGALKELATVGGLEADARAADAQRAADKVAGRLAEVKQSLVAVRKFACDRGEICGGGPTLSDAANAEHSLRHRLSLVQQRLSEGQHRVAEKTARLARLYGARAAHEANPPVYDDGLGPGNAPALEALERTANALRMGNRQAARARDLIAENLGLRSALNGQLEADVREQAAAVVELLVSGTAAQRDAAAFDEQHARAVAEYERVTARKTTHKRHIQNQLGVLESHRRKMVADKQLLDAKYDAEFVTDTASDLESLNTYRTSVYNAETDDIEIMELVDWIDNGPFIQQMYGRNDSRVIPSSTADSDELKSDGTSLSSEFVDFTYPLDKVNRFKYEGVGVASRAIEAMDYVCETLGFSNGSEVMRYMEAVNSVDWRLRRMIEVRIRFMDHVDESRHVAVELESERVNCTPLSTLRLERDIERVRRDGLDVQRSRMQVAQAVADQYGTLFNRLWFQLEQLAAKLKRCHVPVVRKYQLHARKRTECTETMMDAHRMLQGLSLQTIDGGDDDLGGRIVPALSAGPCGHAKPETRPDRCDPTSGLRNPAVDACRKLMATVHAKVRACMVHLGGSLDATDDKQLAALAYFVYDQQSHMERTVLDRRDRNSRNSSRIGLVTDKPKDAVDAGIMTREQVKRQADDIVKWFQTPRDADTAVRSRKPISFRKSRMLV